MDIVQQAVDDFRTGKIVVGASLASMPDISTLGPLKRGVQLRADAANTGTIMVAESSDVDVTNGPGFPLLKDESIFVAINNPKKLIFKASASGQILWFLAQ